MRFRQAVSQRRRGAKAGVRSPFVKGFSYAEGPISIGGDTLPRRVIVRHTDNGAFHFDMMLGDGEGPTWPPAIPATNPVIPSVFQKGGTLGPNMGGR